MATKKNETYAICDRCKCLLPARALVADEYGTVCASLIRCERRRRERIAAERALRDMAIEEGVR